MRPAGDRILFSFSYQGERLRPTLPLKPTPANMRHAARLAAEIREKIRHGTFVLADYFSDYRRLSTPTAAGKTVGDYIDAWLVGCAGLSPSTQNGYRKAATHWRTWFGEKEVAKVLHSDVVRAIGGHAWGSNKTRNNVLSVGKQIFALAERDGALKTNPVDGVPFLDWQAEDPDPLDLAEVELQLAALAERYGQEVADYYEFAIFTGLRPSEQIEAKWTALDERRGVLRVAETRVRGIPKAGQGTGKRNQDGQAAITASVSKRSTKTHHARDVMLNSRALAVIQRQKARTRLKGAHIFLNPNTGLPWADESAQGEMWRGGLVKAKLRHRPPYQARHTCATLLLMAGANPAWAAGQMGHTVEMFFRTYSRWIKGDDQDRAEMGKLERFINTATDGRPIAKGE